MQKHRFPGLLLAVAAACFAACGGGDDSELFESSAGGSGGGAGAGGGSAGTGVAGEAGSTTDASSGAGGSGGEGGSAGAAGTAAGAGGDDAGTSAGAAGSAGSAGAGAAGASGQGAGGAAGGGAGGQGGAAGGAAGAGGCSQPTTFYVDADTDGYGDANASTAACTKPSGYVENDDDCYDGNVVAKPNQQSWFTDDRGDGSYDFDCNGSADKRWTTTGACSFPLCLLAAGWQGSAPACGVEQAWISACVSFPFCAPQTEQRKQECH